MIPAQRETGSVLVEALVAVAIVATMSGLWFETLSSGALRQRTSADRRTALLVARSQLATVGVFNALAPGESQGSDAGFSWQIAIEPDADTGPGVDLVTIVVARPGGAPLARLQTLRLGSSDAAR